MALFKISKGLSSKIPALNNQNTQDGWCWFTTDDGLFHIDFESNGVLQRKTLNANDAKTLTGASLKQELNNKADEIPSSAIVSTQIGRLETLIGQNSEEIDTKMDKENPKGTGTFNFNTSYATGTNAVAFGGHAEGSNSFAFGSQSRATGSYSFACGYNTKATGNYSYCGGRNNEASGVDSHAEGLSTLASGQGAHSEGLNTTASQHGAHAEGNHTTASGTYSHAEGNTTTASGQNSHSSGFGTTARTKSQFVIGEFNLLDSNTSSHLRGDYVFIIGKGTADDARSNAMTVDWSGNIHGANRLSHGEGHTVSADGAYAGGSGNTARGVASHAEGVGTTASAIASHSEGDNTNASGVASHAEGSQTFAIGGYSHTEGSGSRAEALYSHAEGKNTTVSSTGNSAHAEGDSTTASGNSSHAEGYSTTASGSASHSEGQSTTASGNYSHAEGGATTASGMYAHAEGISTIASGYYSHAEGRKSEAQALYSHAEGDNTIASGNGAHSGGCETTASADYAFAHGSYLIAEKANQVVFGQFNENNTTDIFQIGYGSSDTARKNVFAIDTEGDVQISKSLNIGGLSDDTGEAHTLFVSGPAYLLSGADTHESYTPTKDTHLVPKKYVQDNLPTLSHKYIVAEESQGAFDFSTQGITSLENYCLVYYDGLLLIEGIHYTISTNKTSVILLDWMANAGHVIQVVSSAPINPDNSLFN